MISEKAGGVLGSPVGVGDATPTFELPALIEGVRKTFRLGDYRGKKVVLAFYPFNWQDASMQQMAAYQAQRARVLASNAETVAINVESIMNTTAWERENGPFDFPLCSDFWPHGEVAAQYGVLRASGAGTGASERAIFIVDGNGRIVFRKVYEWDDVPSLDELWPVLESA